MSEVTNNVGEVTKSVVEAIVPTANASDEVVNETADAEVAVDTEVSAESEASADIDAIMQHGKKVYTTCAACHGADGTGIAGVFPAIAGSPVANGPVEDHINLILYGKPGTAMAAFAKQLNDEEVAAVITYQRNSFGNNTGDVVLPQDIKAQRN